MPMARCAVALPTLSCGLHAPAHPRAWLHPTLRIEKALRRFRKASNNCGHLRILRNRKTFECAHDKKIRKAKESAMRLARARRSARNRANAGF